jgi:hypothetical protein
MKIEKATVKVMRSFDYCHFEVSLSASGEEPSFGAVGISENTDTAIDNMRKEAARLVDKAVEQYKLAKENAQRMESDGYRIARFHHECQMIGEKPEGDRTPRDKAMLKTLQDGIHARRRYNYEDDWSEQDDWQEPNVADGVPM